MFVFRQIDGCYTTCLNLCNLRSCIIKVCSTNTKISNTVTILIKNHLKPYEEQKENLQFFFKNWIGKVGKQLDDVRVLGIKINFRA
jgi:hypothetical protein